MSEKLKAVFNTIDTVSEKAGRVVSLLALVLMVIVVSGVVARYVFHVSFIWAQPINKQVFALFILFAGVYAMLKGSHLRVEVLYTRFSPRARLRAGLVDLVVFLIFMVVFIWQTGWMAGGSLMNLELSQGHPKIPLYIIKTLIPMIAILFLLQGISAFFQKGTR